MNVNYFNDNNKMLKNNFYYGLCFLGGIYRNSNLQALSLERERF